MSSYGKSCAIKLIELFVEKHCDYTLLFRLEQAYSLINTRLGDDLNKLLETVGLSLDKFLVKDMKQEFFKDFFRSVRHKLREEGVVKLHPDKVLVTHGKGGKAEVLEKLKQVSWPRPFVPYCMQTMGRHGVLFIVCHNWRDGLILQRDIFEMGGYVYYGVLFSVEQVYEHQWSEERMVGLMIDWELMVSSMGGRMNKAQVDAMADRFPAWLVGGLKEKKMLHDACKVECVVKNKTRYIPEKEDWKVSKHFLFNITCTQEVHTQALRLVIGEFLDELKELHSTKSLRHISERERIELPVWGWDDHLIRGQNGISTLFGRKRGESVETSPFPSVDYKLVVDPYGEVEKQTFNWCGEKLSSGHMNALDALYRCSYTANHSKMISYVDEFVAGCQVIF